MIAGMSTQRPRRQDYQPIGEAVAQRLFMLDLLITC